MGVGTITSMFMSLTVKACCTWGYVHQSCILPWKKTVEINELQYKCMPVLNSNQVHMHVHVSYFSSPFASFNVILWGKYHKICVGKQVKADLVTLTRNMKFFFSFWRLTYLVPFQKVRLSYACKKIVSTLVLSVILCPTPFKNFTTWITIVLVYIYME